MTRQWKTKEAEENARIAQIHIWMSIFGLTEAEAIEAIAEWRAIPAPDEELRELSHAQRVASYMVVGVSAEEAEEIATKEDEMFPWI